MLDQVRARLRREFGKDRPPPYDCISPSSRALTPLAQHDPVLAAILNAGSAAAAITARAIAEQKNTAKALETALRRIRTAVPEFVRAYGLENDHRAVERIWARAITDSADTARDIAQSRNRSCAIKLARRIEAKMADGSADEMLYKVLNYINPTRWGPRASRGLSTEPRIERRGEIVEQAALKTSPEPPTHRA